MGEQISQDISIPPSNTSSTLLLLKEKLVMEKGPHECVRAYQIERMALRPVSVSKALVDFIYRPSRSTTITIRTIKSEMKEHNVTYRI